MILLDDFYSILLHEHGRESVKARISFNSSHKILGGHFPGLPIVPGVCMMQIVRETMEVTTAIPLRIVAADSIKFLSVINPMKDNIVEVDIGYTENDGIFLINASLYSGAIVFFKIKATLQT